MEMKQVAVLMFTDDDLAKEAILAADSVPSMPQHK